MKGYTAVLPNGEAIVYVDRKRYLWTLSVLYPLQPFLGIWLHAETGNEAWLLLPLLLAYGINPVYPLSNPLSRYGSQEFIRMLEDDKFGFFQLEKFLGQCLTDTSTRHWSTATLTNCSTLLTFLVLSFPFSFVLYGCIIFTCRGKFLLDS